MPSTMIHLLTAYEVKKEAPDLFWVGNFAPDYVNEREFKDKIHFRDCINRLESLKELKNKIDINNPFEEGWLLHLFADLCWDEEVISLFKENHIKSGDSSDWFLKYRTETSLASYALFHSLEWSPKIWQQILNADLSEIRKTLPVTAEDISSFRIRVYQRHLETKTNFSLLYTEEMIKEFAKKTALKYLNWINK